LKLYYYAKELLEMKKLTQALLATGLISAVFAVQAQESSISGNVALTTDYIYRGISQTSSGSAIQGGLDWAGDSGFYLGTWASSITFADSIEIDYYGGFAGSLTEEIGYDIGFLYYDYPGVSSDDFLEFYGVLSYGDLSGSINYSDDFYAGTGKAWFYTLDYGFDLGNDFALGLHYGYSDFDQDVFGTADSYTEYNISLSKSYAGLDFSVMYTDTNISKANCGSSACSDTLVFTVGKSL
jgi:uncharacterized protein (TIGR02001 family)